MRKISIDKDTRKVCNALLMHHEELFPRSYKHKVITNGYEELKRVHIYFKDREELVLSKVNILQAIEVI